MAADDLLWQVEELCVAARPAVVREVAHGWAFGRSGGRVRHANCVNPLRGMRGDPLAAIVRGEAFYAACGQVPLFRVPTIANEMDVELDRFEYGLEGSTVTLLNPLETPLVEDPETVLKSEPDTVWLEARARISGDSPENDAAYCDMVRCIVLPKIFAATAVDGRIASIAYGVISNGMMVLDSVATDAEFRQRGLARRTLQTLISHSKRRGADSVCLQVVADNAPARALYASLGFDRELYRYHYRRKMPAE